MRNRDRDTTSLCRSEAAPEGRNRIRLRRLARDPGALALVRSVAIVRDVAIEELLQANRGGATVARSRQLAMYLVHVLLGRRQDVVATLFGRDRTTVSHACHLMEDRRDDPSVEREIQQVEHCLATQRGAVNAELNDVA